MSNYIVKLKKLKNYPILLLFFGFILIFSAIDILMPDKDFSEFENKYLQQNPKLTFDSLYSNEYSQKYEKYINEQFTLRNKWIDLKSRFEFFMGKTENNSIVYGKNNYMFDKIQKINEQQLDKNVEHIKKFLDKYNDKSIKFALAPNSYEILKGKLPYGLKLFRQRDMINNVYAKLSEIKNVEIINFVDALDAHNNEYVYYKTDHHWTNLGAYYAYVEFMESLGKDYVDISNLKANEVEGFLGTYFSKAKKFNSEFDKITYYDVNIDKMIIKDKEYADIYDYEKFKTRDKYAAFLYGNNDLTIITNKDSVNKQDKSRILIIKDSFGNSFVPYLTYSYDEVYVLDLRFNSQKVSEIMGKYDFDDILIMYSTNNFIEDSNLMKLGY
jgi:hypothetical protein